MPLKGSQGAHTVSAENARGRRMRVAFEARQEAEEHEADVPESALEEAASADRYTQSDRTTGRLVFGPLSTVEKAAVTCG